jgi:hypothetical protein
MLAVKYRGIMNGVTGNTYKSEHMYTQQLNLRDIGQHISPEISKQLATMS